MAIHPHLKAGRSVWTVSFRHPDQKKVVTRSLGTDDEHEAREICVDIERIIASEVLRADRHATGLLALHPRAALVYHGEDPHPQGGETVQHGEAPALHLAGDLARRRGRARREREQLAAEVLTAVDRQRLKDLELENTQLRRRLNRHCVATLGGAFDGWVLDYKFGRAPKTFRRATAIVGGLVERLGRNVLLRDVAAREVQAWLTARELAPQTVKQFRAYASVFFGWCKRTYELTATPMDYVAPTPGAARTPEQIVAIRSYDELSGFIAALAPQPYWQALIATALLAGPRWAELVSLRRENVFLADGYLRIATYASGQRKVGTKTGRERNVPIEQTILKPLLERYLKREPVHPAGWLFPALIERPELRKSAPAGRWSDQTFTACLRSALAEVRAGIERKKRKDARLSWACWGYRPREWRHTFGTVLGQCGWSALEIARAMGNSAPIAERHYIAITQAGKRWPLRW